MNVIHVKVINVKMEAAVGPGTMKRAMNAGARRAIQASFVL